MNDLVNLLQFSTPIEDSNIEALLSQITDIHISLTSGNRFLHFAAQRGHWNAVQLLLSRGANPNAVDKSKQTLLQKLIFNYYDM